MIITTILCAIGAIIVYQNHRRSTALANHLYQQWFATLAVTTDLAEKRLANAPVTEAERIDLEAGLATLARLRAEVEAEGSK